MLWRLAHRHKIDLIRQSEFQVILAGFFGTTDEEIQELVQCQELICMMHAAKGDRNDEMVSIQQFMQRYYKKLDGDSPLEDMDWDMRLLRRLKEALQCDTEVACHAWREWGSCTCNVIANLVHACACLT